MASISSSRSLPKPASKVSFRDPTAFDLFYQLIYMSAVASAGVPRTRLFQLASRLVRAPADYFRRIHLLCEKLGYNYSTACNMVGQKTGSEAMKSFLLRFADALCSGHPEAVFLAQEAKVQRDAYEKEYDRNLASLTKWTDAYAALVVSSALIIIVNLTSALIYDLGTTTAIVLIATAVLASAGGAWVISRAAPCEAGELFASNGPPLQRLALLLLKITPVVILLLCVLLKLLGVGLGWLVIVAGVSILPLGIVSMRAAAEVEGKDKEMGPFLRSFGAVAISTGATLAEALNRIDLSSFPRLLPDMKKLGWRFKAALPPALCWRKFAVETGSRLISDTITVFYDAIDLGGEADTVGMLCSEFATTEVMLRARRKSIGTTFAGLTIVMHAAVSALMIMILEVVRRFTEYVAAASASLQGLEAMRTMQLPMLSFGSPLLGILGTLTYAMVIVLAVIDAFAIIAADGGHPLKMSFFLAILLTLSGVSMVIMPPFVASILRAI